MKRQTRPRSSSHDGLPRPSLSFPPRNDKGWGVILSNGRVSSLYKLHLFRLNSKMKLHLVLFPLCFLFLSFLHGADRKVTIIHKQGQFGCHTFRIPAMVATNKGTLLAVYDMRYNSRRDLQGHMDIGLSRSTDGGETWARPVPIMDMKKFGGLPEDCLLYTSPSPRDLSTSRMPSSA